MNVELAVVTPLACTWACWRVYYALTCWVTH